MAVFISHIPSNSDGTKYERPYYWTDERDGLRPIGGTPVCRCCGQDLVWNIDHTQRICPSTCIAYFESRYGKGYTDMVGVLCACNT